MSPVHFVYFIHAYDCNQSNFTGRGKFKIPILHNHSYFFYLKVAVLHENIQESSAPTPDFLSEPGHCWNTLSKHFQKVA